jgi:2-polyprenyl-3-methyl-5-hydroxy-6-metoxy-1,4-benzoquinol methylase
MAQGGGPSGPDVSSSAETLAEEIRRAVPSRPAGEVSGVGSPLAKALAEADRFVVPSVEPGAPFYRTKRLLLRVLRLITRSQGSFNARLLQGTRELERAVVKMREERSREIEDLRRQVDLVHARLSVADRGAPGTGSEPSVGAGLPDGFYVRFEEEFRGPEASVRGRQSVYTDFFRGADGAVLDCGCGRGEFLEVLRGAGVAAEGVDSNSVALELARAKGLTVRLEDALVRLESETAAFGGIAALQFVEHLSPADVYRFLRLSFGALRPGGRLLVETVNPDSHYAMRAYRLDPTHRWPVPADTLGLMAREVGFVDREVRYFSPVPEAERLEELSENDRKLNRWIFGPQDYALFARRPEPVGR